MSSATAIQVRPVSLQEWREAGDGLFRLHYDEVARNKRVMVLDPDWPKYEALAAAGMLVILGAFDGDALVGYSASFLATHPHYRGLLIGQNDALFVLKERRAGRVGVELIRETERVCMEHGARLMLWHAKQGTTLERLMPRLGYGVQDVIFAKEIG